MKRLRINVKGKACEVTVGELDEVGVSLSAPIALGLTAPCTVAGLTTASSQAQLRLALN